MIDAALEQLKELIKRIDQCCQNHYSETDTRVKFIDPLLTDILGWNEDIHIKREESYTDDEGKRCIDYVISLDIPVLVVEAKKFLKEFEIPTTTDRIEYSLKGVIQDWQNAWEAISQVQRYCVSKGARYAIVTNGRQYIGFKAISEYGSWLSGKVMVLGSPEILLKNITFFYECFSRETINQDRLSEFAFPKEIKHRKKPHALIHISNSGYRNELSHLLRSVFGGILLDVPDSGKSDFLRECYCTNVDTMKYRDQLNSVLVDPLPIFRTPIDEIRPGYNKDIFDKTIKEIKPISSNIPLFVIMGGAGVGKTTFLRWYFNYSFEDKPKKKCTVIFCDFRSIVCHKEELHNLIIKRIIEGLYETEVSAYLSSFNQLREIFKKRINRELEGALKPFVNDDNSRDKEIGKILEIYQDHSIDHLIAIISYLKNIIGEQVLVVIDNIDQKESDIQNELYQIGQELVYACNLVVLISLREGTYKKILNTPNYNAFACRDYHVKAQPLDLVLIKRFEYLSKRLSPQKTTVSFSGKQLDVVDFDKFLGLIRRSLLGEKADPCILECISSLSNGNIREQLSMIQTFLESGQTKVDDYFWKYAAHEDKFIPFHEVLHSLILEDRKYFEEGKGHRFLNIFEPANYPRASHFTGLRILKYLHEGLGQTGNLQPNEFIVIDDLVSEFSDYGWTTEEVKFHIDRMSQFGLLMPESGDVSDMFREQPFALAKCGLYYLISLYANFTYFSAMAIDTSLYDEDAAFKIAELIRKNVSVAKIPLDIRLNISGIFLGYLDSKEQEERRGVLSKHSLFSKSVFVSKMISNHRIVKEI